MTKEEGRVGKVEVQEGTWCSETSDCRVTSIFILLLCTYLPSSSEKLMPSLIFPPTTLRRRAPLSPVVLPALDCPYTEQESSYCID